MAERLFFACAFTSHWLTAKCIHHFVVKLYIRRSLFPQTDIRGGRQGQSLCSDYRRKKKSHHQSLSFCIWTTLQCSLPVDSFCWCHSIVCRPLISMRAKAEGDWEWGDGNGEPAEEARMRHRAGFYLQLLDHWLISLTQVRLLPVLRSQSGMWSFRNWCDSMYIFELCAHYWICRSLMNAKHRIKCNVLSINLLLPMALEGSVEGLLIS